MAAHMPIKAVVEGLLKLQEAGDSASLIGIGPMSANLLAAVFELAEELDFPPMFIASRNQVDSDEFGSGYVNAWDQERFSADIRAAALAANYQGDYYLCRDHGGPWQRDEERNAHLDEAEAMERARRSYLADLKAGFDLLMIDPTKDPYQIGKVIPLDVVLSRTVELIQWCEDTRKELGLPEVAYEVGTEETNGGLTSTDKYQSFVDQLTRELKARDLPMPSFIVGQTGTLVRMTAQAGHFDFSAAISLATMAAGYGVGLKEHNGDYLDDVTMLEHLPARVTAVNVAPQFGTEETRAYLALADLEQQLVTEGLLANPSALRNTLLDHAIRTERWRKWMVGPNTELSIDDIFANEELANQVLDIAGHYVFNNTEVKEQIESMSANLAPFGIDVARYATNCIKRSIRSYVECFNLKGLNTRLRAILA